MADKIEDFGKKIGGARKDLQSILKTRGIEVNDTVEWTEEEREKYILKKQVWKEPDFEQMVKDGLPVTVAYYIKHLRDSLPAKPFRNNQEYQEGYIRMIADIRDHAMELTTDAECRAFFRNHVEDVYCTHRGHGTYRPTKDAFGCMTTKFLRAAMISERQLQAEIKKKRFLFSEDDELNEDYRICLYDGKNVRLLSDRGIEYKYASPRSYNPDYIATSYFYRASSYTDTVPLFESMDNWQAGTYFVVARTSTNDLIAGNLESENAARQFAREDFAKRKEAAGNNRTRKGKFTPAPLENVERNGEDYRDGKDISGQDMLDRFGFLGGEFGNWENQNDRQFNLNYAYDAFRDLAIALDVDPKDISLDGQLSIAFGSRGRGNALAHFEPDRNVINLTKLKGAGSLAHEWGHAFDRFISKAMQLHNAYASSGGYYHKPDMDLGISRLVEAMNWNEDGSQTKYLLASKEMDRKYSRDSMGYWSSNVEMFARAFAVYVQDKLAEKGSRSDYLCGHAESSIYPEGAERERLNKLFDGVISEMKTRGIFHAAQNTAAEATQVEEEVATSSNSETEIQTSQQQNNELMNLFQAMTLQKGDVIRLNPMTMLDSDMIQSVVPATIAIIREITDNTVDYQSFDMETLKPTWHSVAFMTLNQLAQEGFEKIGNIAELTAQRQAEEAAEEVATSSNSEQESAESESNDAEEDDSVSEADPVEESEAVEEVATSSNSELESAATEPESISNDAEEGEKVSEFSSQSSQYVTPIGKYSEIGASKLRELADNPDGYRELMRMTGRIFKLPTSVALEFYALNPDKHYEFISAAAGWEKTGYHLKAGATGVVFSDKKDELHTLYDFDEVVEDNKPNVWKLTSTLAPKIKQALQLPESEHLVNGLTTLLNADNVTKCLEKLGITITPYLGDSENEPNNTDALTLDETQQMEFAASFINSVQQIIAGRLEVGNETLDIPVDTAALQMMQTDEQRFIVLSYIGATAKDTLRRVDEAVKTIQLSEISERKENNDIHGMEQAEQRAAEQNLGQRSAGSTVTPVTERTDLQQGDTQERSNGLAGNTADQSRRNLDLASRNQGADGEGERRNDQSVSQAGSDNSSIYSADQQNGESAERGTGREVRNDVDAMDGGQSSGESRMDDAQQPVSDSSTVGGTENAEVHGTAGSAVSANESASGEELQRSTGVGTGEAISGRESGDQGRSVSGGYNSVIAAAFSPENEVNASELTFAEQVDAIVNGTRLNGDIQVCATSDILQQVGCRNLPMMYTKLHMADALHEKSESNPHYHGLTAEQMKQLPEQITAPAMIFDSISNRVNGTSSIIIVLGSMDNDSAPLLMSIKPNGRGKLNADTVDANFITSIYGKEHDFADYIERIVANNSVLYCDQAKMQSLFAQLGQPVPQSLTSLVDKTVLHQSRNIANGFGQTFTVQDDINGQQPISTERRKQIMNEFQIKHGLKGTVYVGKDHHYNDGQNGRAYDLLIKTGKQFSFRQRAFLLESGEYFSEKKLLDSLAAMEQNPAFRKYLEQQANAQRVQERTVRVGDKFRVNMQELEVASLDGGIYPDDVVVKNVYHTKDGGEYTVTSNVSLNDLLKGEYLGNSIDDKKKPELTNEELAAKEVLKDLSTVCLSMASDEMSDYSDALFDTAIAERYEAMNHPPVNAAFLEAAKKFQEHDFDPAGFAKAISTSGGVSVQHNGRFVFFDRLAEEEGVRFACRNVSSMITWQELGRLQLGKFHDWYVNMHEEIARDYPEIAEGASQKIAVAAWLMRSCDLNRTLADTPYFEIDGKLYSYDGRGESDCLIFSSNQDDNQIELPETEFYERVTPKQQEDISTEKQTEMPVEEVAASNNSEIAETAAAEELETVMFETLSNGTIVAHDMEDPDSDTNEFPIFAVIQENGTVEFTTPFYSNEQETAVQARAAEQKAAFADAWNALPEGEQYNRVCTSANEAQYSQIFHDDAPIAEKIAKYAPSIIFGEAEFPVSADSLIAKWAETDRIYFDGNQNFTWCFYSQDTQNFVINSFDLNVLKEAMRYDKPTEIIQQKGSQQQISKTDDVFAETVQSYLKQHEDFSIPSRSHGALRELAGYLDRYYQMTISQIDIPEYGLSVDLAQIDSIDLITREQTYEGGIDSDGHERKDNFSEKTNTVQFFMQDGFIQREESDTFPYPASNAEMVKAITEFLDRSRDSSDLTVQIRYGGETGTEIFDANAHFVEETVPVEEVATSSNFEVEAAQTEKNESDYLREELMRGSGFENGKFRIQEYYLTNNPDSKEFAQFLKNEYGLGGHSGPDMPSVTYDGKGILIRTADKSAEYLFKWTKAAEEIISLIEARQYITAEDIHNRIYHAEYEIRTINLDDSNLETYGDDRILQQAHETMRIYGTRFNRLEETERKFWCENSWNRPSESPWGEIEHCAEWGHGVYVVDTAGRGGMMIPERLAEQILTPEALFVAGKPENGFYCFEKDADMWVPALELYDKGVIEEQDDWRHGYYRSITEAVNLHRPEYAAARELAQNAVIDHALHPDAVKDIYVTLDYENGELYYFKTTDMTINEFRNAFGKYEKPMEAMRNLGQPVTVDNVAYAEQNTSIYSVNVNVYHGRIEIADYVNGDFVGSSMVDMPDSMKPHTEETAATSNPETADIPTMTVTEKLQADFDSYVNSLKETGDFMAVVNASAEIAAKQNILKYLETPPEVTEEQRIALVNQDDLLNTVYRKMEEGTAFASQEIASEILVKLAKELAPTPVEPEPIEETESEATEIPVEADQTDNIELPQGVVPLYRESFDYAKEHDELDQYRASRRENDACSAAITDISHDHYNDNILDSETIYTKLCEKYDPDRIALIMANAVIQADWDARYYSNVRKWAAATVERLNMQSPIKDTPRPTLHPGLMNILAQRIIDVEQNVQTQKQTQEDKQIEAVAKIPQEIIDNLIRKGNDTPYSDEHIIVGMAILHDPVKQAEFLRDEFGRTSTGVLEGENRYAAQFSAGISVISIGSKADTPHKLRLTWEDIAQRTNSLLAAGHFADAETVKHAPEQLRAELASDIVSNYREFAQNYFVESQFFAASENQSVDLLKLYLKDTEFCKSLIDRLQDTNRAEQADLFMDRMQFALALSADTNNVQYDASVKFVIDPAFQTDATYFISDDDKWNFAMSVANQGTLDRFYSEEHTMTEKEMFLHSRFGLTRTVQDGRIADFSNAGIQISKIDKSGNPIANTMLSWKEAAELLEKPMMIRLTAPSLTESVKQKTEAHNAQIIESLKEGDVISFRDQTYRVAKIQGDFMCNLQRINDDGSVFTGTGEAGHQLIGNWKSTLLSLADSDLIITDEPLKQTFEIYQMKSGDRFHYQRFESYESLQQQNFPVDFKNYDPVYSGTTPPNTTLEDIYTKFNLDRPEDFTGHSLSVGDIIVLRNGGTLSGTQDNAFFVDDIGFKPVPEFVSSRKTLRAAIQSIDDFSENEYGTPADVSDLEHIDLAYTTTENEQHEIQIYANLMDCTIVHTIDGEVDDTEQYTDLEDMTRRALRFMTFDSLVSDTLSAAEDDMLDDEVEAKEATDTQTEIPDDTPEEEPQRSYDPKSMKKQIKALDSTEDFYEKVREIIGYYQGVQLSDHVIKSLQAVADARFEQLRAQENRENDTFELQIGDHVRYDGQEWAVERIDGDFYISLQNLDPNAQIKQRGSTHWRKNLEGLEKIEGFGIPNHAAPKPVKEHGRVQTEGQLNLFDFNNTTDEPEQTAENAMPDNQNEEQQNIEAVPKAADSKWKYYIVADMATWSQSEAARSELERFDTLDAVIMRFNELREQAYNNEPVYAENNADLPLARLTLGAQIDADQMAFDLIQVRGGQNVLNTDYTRYELARDDAELQNTITALSEKCGIDGVLDFREENGQFTAAITSYTEWLGANNASQEAAPQQSAGTRIQKQLYQLFAEKFPDMVSGEHTYERYGSLNDLEDDGNGVEPLSIEFLGENQFGMMMFYEQNGDLMRDPDYVFEIDPEAKTIQALEYQQDGVPSVGTLYQSVLRNDGTVDLHLQAAIEKSLLQTLKHIDDFERPLTSYNDSEGEHDLTDEIAAEPIDEAPTEIDRNDYLREVLNEFSERHGFGELNLTDGRDNVFELNETLADGTEITLGWLHGSYYSPFTPETLRTALNEFEQSYERRNEDITDARGRHVSLELHGGISKLPDVPENLPEIVYAKDPGMKIRANLDAIREINRLERREAAGEPLYEKRAKDYFSKENSDRRLRAYSGWGGLPQIFDESFTRLKGYREELQSYLTPEEYAAARASTMNAHYTPQVVIDAMYKAIKQMDLPRDSRILEPSCGTGNFITRMPHSIGNAGIVGVELDGTTAKIAKYLAADRENVTIMNCGFENSGLEDNSFDLAIGNIPFGSNKLRDPDYTKDWLIHDAFFRKALDKVAPGGVVAFITSTGTMDKKNPRVREYLATRANLIGAIRLPNNTFEGSTDTPSDIIFLQKREHPLNALDPKPDWCYTAPVTVDKVGKVKEGEQPEKVQAFVNNYFIRNPQMVLGTIKQTSHYNMLTVEPKKSADLAEQLDHAVHNLHGKIAAQRSHVRDLQRQNSIEPWGNNFQFQIQDDKVYYRQGDYMREITDNKKGHISTDAIKMLIPLRDVTRELLEKQQSRMTNEELMPLRKRMTELYDAYIAKYGEINSVIAKKSFGDDSDYAILCALEDKVEDKYVKAAIFTERTVNPYQEVTSAQTVEDAMQISLDQRGKILIPYMAMLLNDRFQEQGIEPDDAMQMIVQELREKELVFFDPEKQVADDPYAGFVERSAYLSGNIRRKLAMAESMAEMDPAYQKNVDALKEVLPIDIPASEISVTMGAAWIDPEDYTKFLNHLSGRPTYHTLGMEVRHSDVTGEYSIPNSKSKKLDLNTAESTTYGTPDFNMYALAERILNQRRIEVKMQVPDPKDPSKTVTRTDVKATKLANEKAKEIRKEFEKWLFAEPVRKEKYEKRYNQLFNSLVPRKYDGSRMTFNGMRAGMQLKPHQLNCIARTVYGGNTLAAHVVGAGKSAVIAASVMKKKELGLIHKALLVVPKPLTEQSAVEWRKFFPDAKLLVVTPADLATEQNREIFTAKVATGDYDAVIVSKEQFQKLGMSPDYQEKYLNERLDEMRDLLAEEKKSNGKSYTVKEIEKIIDDLENRLRNITDPKSKAAGKDKLMNFETLGFDYLVVDEAHNYKNGFVKTKMTNVSGVTTKASGIADDMQMKCDYFNEALGDGHILFATGTPVSNSMTELYVMTRYLRSDLLEMTGTARFDDWAATFGNVTQKNKQNQAGQMQLKTSFSSFKNMPELMQMYKEFADLVSADKLAETTKRPDLITGKPQIIAVEASPEQKEYVAHLAERSLACQNGSVDPHLDNPLKITFEARLVGLGNRAIAALYKQKDGGTGKIPDGFILEHDSKIDACLREVKARYDMTTPESGVQIIFSDIAVNDDDGNFSAYKYMRDRLKDMGIPEKEIVFAPKSGAKNREDIFRDINEGRYRVVIASTGTLGTGANIQKKLYALHNLDIPWKPSDFEQRQGRILRQGNTYDAVEILNYVTKGTMDSFLYQIVTDKARYIAQLWNDECPARIMEDCDETVLTYGHFQAVAQDNPDLLHHLELQNKVDELKLLRTEYRKETATLQRRVAQIPNEIEQTKQRIGQTKKDIDSANAMRDKETGKVSDIVVRMNGGHGEAIREHGKINEYLFTKIQSKAKAPFDEQPAFTIGNFTVSVQTSHKIAGEFEFAIKGERDKVYYVDAAKGQNADNYRRLSNFFDTGIEKELALTEQKVESLAMEQNQSIERIEKPFPAQDELDEAEQELADLDIKLTDNGLLTDGAEYVDGEESNDQKFIPDDNEDDDDTYFAERSM